MRVDNPANWLIELTCADTGSGVDGLVLVSGFRDLNPQLPPEQYLIMEKAEHYQAHSVFFEAGRNGRPPVAQAFVYVSDQPGESQDFAVLHKRLWSWGAVPLLYRKTPGKVELFRCAHQADFDKNSVAPEYAPHKEVYIPQTLDIAATIAADPLWQKSWWNAGQLRNGTLWDDPEVCDEFLNSGTSAHRKLVKAVEGLNRKLVGSDSISEELQRRLLILSLLIAYLEERDVLKPAYFASKLAGATKFFHVLRKGPALVGLLEALDKWFNGTVFELDDHQKSMLRTSNDLEAFATLIEGYQEVSGQLSFWKLYSFQDLPVELISEIYQLFVNDSKTAVYTPPALVRLIVDEALDRNRLKALLDSDQVILDPACGSGVFLVEAYKRLVLLWRSENGWEKPPVDVLKDLVKRVHGVDVEEAAVELANFSLCLAICDALLPDDIRKSVRLFPKLKGKSLLQSCFFEAKEGGLLSSPIGIVIGNPPFTKKLNTDGARDAYKRYCETFENLPGIQLAYLFLHETMSMLEPNGILAMIQHCGLFYNRGARPFRKRFFDNWNVREVLDFVSVRGLFSKDTMVVAVVASANLPTPDRKVLHAVFRRNGRADAEQSFDVDYYDMHWLPASTDWSDLRTWRINLLGGGRVATFLKQMIGHPTRHRTLGEFSNARGWDAGEGFKPGSAVNTVAPEYPFGEPFLPTEGLGDEGIILPIERVEYTTFERPRSQGRYEGPLLLIKEHMDLHRTLWDNGPLAFKDKIVGFSAPNDVAALADLSSWISREQVALTAFVAGISGRLFSIMATAISQADIMSLPFPLEYDLNLSDSEKIIANDIVRYQRDLIRLGDKSDALTKSGYSALPAFNETFLAQINGIYTENPLIAHPHQSWPGIICQPYSFGPVDIDWSESEGLRGRLDALLKDRESSSLSVTRIARIYDDNMLFLIKPDRLRYWLRSIALRDSDEVLADLRAQGY